MRDAVTTQALNQLRDQMREIQKSMGNGQQGPGDKDRQALEQALAQTETPAQRDGARDARPATGPAGRPKQGRAKGQQPGQQSARNRASSRVSAVRAAWRRATWPDRPARQRPARRHDAGLGPAWGDARRLGSELPPYPARSGKQSADLQGSARQHPGYVPPRSAAVARQSRTAEPHRKSDAER